MFFSLFWTAYIPIGMIILALAGERLMHSFRRRACMPGLPLRIDAEPGPGQYGPRQRRLMPRLGRQLRAENYT